jgi:4-carboxymuconolactone decarboxylase
VVSIDRVDDVMAISEEAQRNHDALFPDHHSTLKVTDPPYVGMAFDNSLDI